MQLIIIYKLLIASCKYTFEIEILYGELLVQALTNETQ